MAELEQQSTAAPAATSSDNDFSALLQREFKPKSDAAGAAVKTAVRTLASQALVNTALVSDDAIKSIQAIIAEIDGKLTDQVNLILHNEEFQKLESAWRGLHYLVNNTETDENLKIRVLNVSKKELHRSLMKFKGVAWDQSPLFKQVYEQEFGQLGGQPYGCLVGDYHFSHSAVDCELLGELSKIAAAAHAPLITGASPITLDMDSWQELSNPRDLTKIFETPQYTAWRALRESDDSRYVGLAMPRFLARLPYGPDTNPVDEFDFVERTDGGDHGKYAWANAAYAMAVNINRSFKNFGWCSSIRGVQSGGEVPNLPTHCFPSDDGGMDAKCPTEIAISDRREAELAKNGFMPLLHRKNSDQAVFMGAQSLHKPAVFDDPDATSNANISARLPYLFAVSRFAHYLKCMVRDQVGRYRSAEAMQRELQEWILRYVDGDPNSSSDEVKAQRPLSAAEVVVAEVPGNPGYYTSKFFLRPHYQLEGLNVSLRLVSKLPSAKAA